MAPRHLTFDVFSEFDLKQITQSSFNNQWFKGCLFLSSVFILTQNSICSKLSVFSAILLPSHLQSGKCRKSVVVLASD